MMGLGGLSVMLIFLMIFSISLIFSVGLILCGLHIVRVRQALIVYDYLTGRVRRTLIGPRIVIIWPFERTRILDLTMRAVHLNPNDIVTSDLAVTVSLDIFYALDPAFLQVANLDRVLPFLTNVEQIIRSWSGYVLRSLAAGSTTAELLAAPAHRARIEHLLHQTLQDRVQRFGVRIYTIRLLCHPTPILLEARLAAARTQLLAQARARALELLVTTLGPDHDMSHILPLELLQRIQSGDAISAFNLSLPINSSINNPESLAIHWLLASR